MEPLSPLSYIFRFNPQDSINAMKLMIENSDVQALNKALNITVLTQDVLSLLFKKACRSDNLTIINMMIRNESYTPAILGNILINSIHKYGIRSKLAFELLHNFVFKEKALNAAFRIAVEDESNLSDDLDIIDLLESYGAKL